ncbi:MAG: CHAT domain-containing protein [Pyrinomonadaceae bacterium]|nr:CHAT domain-containing protein [Pyrinomonadaceae bacterium]
MKNIFIKLRFFLIFSIFLLSVSANFAQTDKLAIAEQSYDKAVFLADEHSAASQRLALEKFQSALILFREIGNKTGEAKTLFQIGTIHFTLGESGEASKNAVEALKIAQKSDEKFWEAKSFNLLGLIYGNLGNYKSALEFFENSLAVFKQIDDFDEAVPVINNIGKVYEKTGDYEKALAFYQIPLEYLEFHEDELSIALTRDNIGGVYFRKGENLKALEEEEKALAIYRKFGNIAREANALNNIGANYLKLGNSQKAIESINQALPLLRATGNKRTEAVALSNLMAAWKISNSPETAIFYGKQTVNLYQEMRRNVQFLDKETQKFYLDSISANYRFLADLLIENGKFAQAEQVLRLLKEEEFFDFVKRDAKEIKTLNQRVILNDKENELLKRYTVLADKIVEIGEEFQKLENKKRILSRTNETLSAEEQKKYDEFSAQITEANTAFRLFLDKELIREIGAEKTKKIEIDRDLQNKLKKWGDGTVAVYTVVTENRCRIILTTPIVQIDGKTEIKAAVLNKKIFDFRNALQNPTLDPRPLGKEIYDILLKPIEKELNAAGAKTLVWSLDGSLRYIPLAALSPDGKNYLVEKYQNVIITPKTRDDLSDSNAEWKALGMGVSEAQTVVYPDLPNERIDVSALPFTKNELNAIIRDETNPNENGVLDGRKFFDKDFTRKNFIDSLAQETADGNRKFTVVHLASHFRLGNNWTDSFLLLGNGKFLTLEELSSSPEIDFGEVELVTLSACNTAFGTDANGKEIDSLAEAIQTKSAKAVLATLWEVSDESTASLMSNFYKLRKENFQITKAEAMQKAQKLLIEGNSKSPKPAPVISADKTNPPKFTTEKDCPFAHPFFWSGFVLIGNWR